VREPCSGPEVPTVKELTGVVTPPTFELMEAWLPITVPAAVLLSIVALKVIVVSCPAASVPPVEPVAPVPNSNVTWELPSETKA